MKKRFALIGLSLMLFSSVALASMANVANRGWVGTSDEDSINITFTLDEWTEVVIFAGLEGVTDAASDPLFTLYDSSGNALSRESSWTLSTNPELIPDYFGFVPDEMSAGTVVGLEAGEYSVGVISIGTSGNVRLIVADYWHEPAVDPYSVSPRKESISGDSDNTDRDIGSPSNNELPSGPGFTTDPNDLDDPENACVYYTNASGGYNVVYGPCDAVY